MEHVANDLRQGRGRGRRVPVKAVRQFGLKIELGPQVFLKVKESLQAEAVNDDRLGIEGRGPDERRIARWIERRDDAPRPIRRLRFRYKIEQAPQQGRLGNLD